MLEQYGIPLYLEKLIFSLAIIVMSFIVAWLTRLILSLIVTRVVTKTKSTLDDVMFEGLGQPIYYLILTGGMAYEIDYIFKSFEFISPAIHQMLKGITFTAAAVLIGWMVTRFTIGITGWYAKRIAEKTKTQIDDEFIPIFNRAFKSIVIVLVLMAILSHFEVDIKGLVAVLGVGSLALALAAQDTLANMIAGFILMIDRPFRVGDRVMFNDQRKLDVYEIGLRSTKFLTLENTLVIIPNAELSKMTIDNTSYPEPTIRVKLDVGVAYGSDVDVVKKYLLEATVAHSSVLKKPEPFIQFINFGESSLDFRIYAFIEANRDQWRIGNAIRENVYKILNRENIEIPFPQRVLHIPAQEVANKLENN